MLLKIKHFLKLKNLKKKLKLKLQQSFKIWKFCVLVMKRAGLLFCRDPLFPCPVPANQTTLLFGRQTVREWRTDGILQVAFWYMVQRHPWGWGWWGSHCSSVTVLHPDPPPPPPTAPGLQSPPLQQSPLTHPHLLVPGPDIAALLRRRLVNTRDTLQFSVSDSVCLGWKASGAERGPQTIRRISTHPSVHKLNRPSLNPFSGDFSLSWFIPLQHIYYTCRLYEKSTCSLKRSVFYLAETSSSSKY